MKQVWKWIMHLNAKAFCFGAALLFLGTAGWCVYLYLTPLEPIKDGTDKLPDAPVPLVIGLLNFVTNQLAGDDLSIPVDPFLPALDRLTPEERAKIIAEIEAARAAGGVGAYLAAKAASAQGQGAKPDSPKDPRNSAGATTAANAPKMITPKIAFLGFFKRSDGTSVAMFSDSSDNSTVFYAPGKTVHGLEVLGADMKEAKVRFPDGSEGTISIGHSVELAPEEDKNPKPAVAGNPAPASPKAPAPKPKG